MSKYLLIYFLIIQYISSAQVSDLQSYIESYVLRPAFRHSSISISVLELSSDKVAGSYRDQKTLIPASSLKLLTTLSAIHYLGKDFQYETQIAHSGDIFTDGTLEGDLYIIGSGDPSLGSVKVGAKKGVNYLSQTIAKDIKNFGISCIAGDVIADESIFNSFPISPSWQWNDLGNYYASGAWGINVNDNQYHIYFAQRAKEGMIPKLKSYRPYIPGLELQNEVETGAVGTGDNAYIFGGPYHYTKRVVGTIPPGSKDFSIKGSIPDPPLFMAYYLQGALQKLNITSADYRSVHDFNPQKIPRKIIQTYQSLKLRDLVFHTNNKSDNLYAEALLKTIGHIDKKKGSGRSGISAIIDYMEEAGISTSGIRMDDGSGLSARNRVSSRIMAEFLKASAAELGLKEVCSYLPKGGVDGTVASLFRNSAAKGRVWLKSGSMEGIMSYSGYMKSKSGTWHSFCLMVNGYDVSNRKMRPILEQMMTAIYERT